MAVVRLLEGSANREIAKGWGTGTQGERQIDRVPTPFSVLNKRSCMHGVLHDSDWASFELRSFTTRQPPGSTNTAPRFDVLGQTRRHKPTSLASALGLTSAGSHHDIKSAFFLQLHAGSARDIPRPVDPQSCLPLSRTRHIAAGREREKGGGGWGELDLRSRNVVTRDCFHPRLSDANRCREVIMYPRREGEGAQSCFHPPRIGSRPPRLGKRSENLIRLP